MAHPLQLNLDVSLFKHFVTIFVIFWAIFVISEQVGAGEPEIQFSKEKTYAILIQGMDEAWLRNNLKLVYNSLLKKGISKERILTLSPNVVDFDEDGGSGVHVLPTLNTIEMAFKKMGSMIKERRGKKNQLFVYIATHGLQGSLYLHYGSFKEWIHYPYLRFWIKNNIPAKTEIILMIDACYSGSFDKVVNFDTGSFFSSSQYDRTAWTGYFCNGKQIDSRDCCDEKTWYGAFTYFFFSALNAQYPNLVKLSNDDQIKEHERNKINLDMDHDGHISLNEAFEFCKEKPFLGQCHYHSNDWPHDYDKEGNAFLCPSYPQFIRWEYPEPLRELVEPKE